MKELGLLIISNIADRLLSKAFFWHGSWISYRRDGIKGLTYYWKECAISNDMNLNVKGQHFLNQRLSKNRVFGNPLMTVSAAKYLAVLENAGKKWEKRINGLDEDHYLKAYRSHILKIETEYNNTKHFNLSNNGTRQELN